MDQDAHPSSQPIIRDYVFTTRAGPKMKANNIESMPKNSTFAYVSNAFQGWTLPKFPPMQPCPH